MTAYILQTPDPGYVPREIHGLIASIADLNTAIQWYNGINGDTGATGTALGTGQANTTTIVTSQGTLGSYAALLCVDYTNTDTGTGAYSDWYLPSKDELNNLYLNKTVIGGFSTGGYWSSSEDTDSLAWAQDFNNGTWPATGKNTTLHVRAVRAF